MTDGGEVEASRRIDTLQMEDTDKSWRQPIRGVRLSLVSLGAVLLALVAWHLVSIRVRETMTWEQMFAK